MNIKVLFFASCRDLIGTGEREMALPDGATVTELISKLASEQARFTDMAPSLMISINQTYVERDAELQDGDEIAFIPPVSGG